MQESFDREKLQALKGDQEREGRDPNRRGILVYVHITEMHKGASGQVQTVEEGEYYP